MALTAGGTDLGRIRGGASWRLCGRQSTGNPDKFVGKCVWATICMLATRTLQRTHVRTSAEITRCIVLSQQ